MSDKKLSLAIAAYREGSADSFKVLSYQEDYVNAQLRVLGAAADYLQALVQLDAVTGMADLPWQKQLQDRERDVRRKSYEK